MLHEDLPHPDEKWKNRIRSRALVPAHLLSEDLIEALVEMVSKSKVGASLLVFRAGNCYAVKFVDGYLTISSEEHQKLIEQDRADNVEFKRPYYFVLIQDGHTRNEFFDIETRDLEEFKEAIHRILHDRIERAENMDLPNIISMIDIKLPEGILWVQGS